jgi:nucleotide-binding universal stress UspA family protein
MIRTILVPASGSETDAIVFETALAAARLCQAHLVFFHIRVSSGEALTPGYMTSPLEAITMRNGDCKSCSIAKYAAARVAGFSADPYSGGATTT